MQRILTYGNIHSLDVMLYGGTISSDGINYILLRMYVKLHIPQETPQLQDLMLTLLSVN